MLVYVGGLPRIADPNISNSSGGQVSILAEHILRQLSFLLLVLVLWKGLSNTKGTVGRQGWVHLGNQRTTYMQDEDRENRLLCRATQFLSRHLDILL